MTVKASVFLDENLRHMAPCLEDKLALSRKRAP